LRDAFQVGDHTAGDAHDVIRVRAKVVIPCSRSYPHLVVLQQVRTNEHAQMCAVTKWWNATFGFGKPSMPQYMNVLRAG